ncbi:hypothetical protein WJX74_002435 [Apatococcus lobatus]|uniref:Uncharacterized protein n=1 Tax=Apatococcus lobatus TaxID=904363 RepID=A0AAW1R2K1_9CHLO
MFNPKSPLQAAAIFLAGVGVIAYTTLDIHRTATLNEKPMTRQQAEALQQYLNEKKHEAATNQLKQMGRE